MFLRYAVLWGALILFGTGICVHALAALAALAAEPPAAAALAGDAAVSVEQTVRSLEDPFDVQKKAPDIVELFLKGVAELKRQLEEKQKMPEQAPLPVPVEPGVAVAPKPKEPAKPKKLEIPAMKITGIVYDTDRPQAIINGKVVGVGSTLEGVEILKIQKGRIDARFQGSDISLKFNNE